MHAYIADHGPASLPPSLEALAPWALAPKFGSDIGRLKCPNSEDFNYVYVGNSISPWALSDKGEWTPIAYEPLENHRTLRNVLFADGHVETVYVESTDAFLAHHTFPLLNVALAHQRIAERKVNDDAGTHRDLARDIYQKVLKWYKACHHDIEVPSSSKLTPEWARRPHADAWSPDRTASEIAAEIEKRLAELGP